MDELKKLENAVKELLGTHNCVTVTGLGSFIYRETAASSNHFTFELKPSGNSVFFNNAIIFSLFGDLNSNGKQLFPTRWTRAHSG